MLAAGEEEGRSSFMVGQRLELQVESLVIGGGWGQTMRPLVTNLIVLGMQAGSRQRAGESGGEGCICILRDTWISGDDDVLDTGRGMSDLECRCWQRSQLSRKTS